MLDLKTLSGWRLEYRGYHPKEEGVREVLCTLGNGYMATRGALKSVTADGTHYPATYLAGGYNTLKTELQGRVVENEDLVNWPNWLCLRLRIDGGDWYTPSEVELLDYRYELDLREGVLHRHVRFRDGAGRVTRLDGCRLVSMRDPHLAALTMTVTPENWSGTLEFITALDGRVENRNVKAHHMFAGRHLEPVDQRVLDQERISLEVRTVQSRLSMTQTARTRVYPSRDVECEALVEPGYVGRHCRVGVVEGGRPTIEKVVAIYTSRDHAVSNWSEASRRAAAEAPGFERLRQRHAAMWDVLWQNFDVVVELEEPETEAHRHVQMLLRLHTFHLLQTVSPWSIDLDVGVPARGWHGEGYQGHVFWDDMFIFPFLNLRMPEITRALLMYRYRRLDDARALARRAGYRGAMYPWQSGADGTEKTPMLYPLVSGGEVKQWIEDSSHLQRHVSASVAYNVWRYYQVTGDIEFLSFYGAEMLFEIARFWVSLAVLNPQTRRYEICDVVGPDEYHDGYPGASRHGLNNNSYTNIMAVWSLRCALAALEELPTERRVQLCGLLEIDDGEVAEWQNVSRSMTVVFQEGGLISQFEGYSELEEIDLSEYREKHGNLQRLDTILRLEGKSPNDYKVSKQADVLMLFYLFSAEELAEIFSRLGYDYDPKTIPATIRYYVDRTVHGSTLSRIAHAWVLSRTDRAHSWQLFTDALISDFADIQGGTTAEGIHLGAMSGTVDIIQRCYTGIVPHREALWLHPVLPDSLRRLKLRIRYQGHTLDLEVTRDAVTVRSLPSCSGPIEVRVRDRSHTVNCGEVVEFDLAPARPGSLR